MPTANTQHGEWLTPEVAAVEALAQQPHTPEELAEAAAALLAKLEQGDIYQTANVQRLYVQQMRDRVAGVLGGIGPDASPQAAQHLTEVHGKLDEALMKVEADLPADDETYGFSFEAAVGEAPPQAPAPADTGDALAASTTTPETANAKPAGLEHTKACYDLAAAFVSKTARPEQKHLIGLAIARYLGDEPPDAHKAGLAAFLNAKVRQKKAIVGAAAYGPLQAKVEGESVVETQERIHAEEQKIHALELEIKAEQAKLEDARLTRQELAQINAGTQVAGQPVVEHSATAAQRATAIGEAKNAQNAISTKTKEIEDIKEGLRVIREASKQKGSERRAEPETVLIYVHQYFKQEAMKKQLEEEGKSPDEVNRAVQKSETSLFQESRDAADGDIANYESAESNVSVLYGIKRGHVIDFLTQKITSALPAKVDAERAKAVMVSLKKLDPGDRAAAEKWVYSVAEMMPDDMGPEKKKEAVQKIVSVSIATIESALAKGKMFRSGVQMGHYQDLVNLKNNIRRGYEQRISDDIERNTGNEEEAARKIMMEVQAFHEAVRTARKTAGPDETKALRAFTAKNHWFTRTMAWAAGGGWGLTRAYAPKIGKWAGGKAWTGVEKAGGWGLKTGWNTAKTHPKKSILAASALFGVFPTAAVMLASYGGLKWAAGKLGFGGRPMRTAPAAA